MKIVATILFTASSEVEFEVPDDTPHNVEALQEAIKQSINDHGLPEVINNLTIDFMFAETCSFHDPQSEEDAEDYEFELDLTLIG